MTAGRNDQLPSDALSSIAGISKLQTEAATITPAAKPMSAFCTRAESSSFITNTHAAPRLVPRNGMRSPAKSSFSIIAHLLKNEKPLTV